MLLRSKLHRIGHGVGDRRWDACVPIGPILNRLRKREQCPIAVWPAHDLKRNRKLSVIETHGDRDGRKAQQIDESREAAERVERGSRELVRSRIGLDGAWHADRHDRQNDGI